MVLKNKDGTVYRLDGPNPTMKTQETWSEFEIHNMKWDEEKSKDINQILPIKSDLHVKDTFLSALDEAKEDIKISENEVEDVQISDEIERKSVVKPDLHKEKIKEKSDIEKTFIHCLPAFLKEKRDDLYDEAYISIEYGNPTSFEGVILSQEDLFIEIWTDVDKINKGSILYPKTGYKRWWRVQNKREKKSGWIITATPSDIQPSFDF